MLVSRATALLARMPAQVIHTDDQIPAKRHRLKHVDIFEITGDELDHIEALGSNVGVNIQVALFCLPVGISFTVTLCTTTITDRYTYDAFMIATIVAYALSAIYGIKAFQDGRPFKARIQGIRDRKTGPLGEEGLELRPSELADLPAEQAGPMQIPLQAEMSVQVTAPGLSRPDANEQ